MTKKNETARVLRVPVLDPEKKKALVDELAYRIHGWEYREGKHRHPGYLGHQGQANRHPNGNLGRCRRHAPAMGGYPVIWSSDWCGDHRLDETKV